MSGYSIDPLLIQNAPYSHMAQILPRVSICINTSGVRINERDKKPRNMSLSCWLIVITHVYGHEYIGGGLNRP